MRGTRVKKTPAKEWPLGGPANASKRQTGLLSPELMHVEAVKEACGMRKFPGQGSNPHPTSVIAGSLAARPPGNSSLKLLNQAFDHVFYLGIIYLVTKKTYWHIVAIYKNR